MDKSEKNSPRNQVVGLWNQEIVAHSNLTKKEERYCMDYALQESLEIYNDLFLATTFPGCWNSAPSHLMDILL